VGLSTSVAAARGTLRLLRRDGLSAAAADEDRQIQLCRIMLWFRHLVVSGWLIYEVLDSGPQRVEVSLVLLLVAQAVVDVWERARPRDVGRAAVADGAALLSLTVLGLPPVVVLLVVVAVLGWAATFRPVPAVLTYLEALAAVALMWFGHSRRPPIGGVVVAFCILGGIFMLRTIRLNIGARRAAEHERLVHERLDAILWEQLPGAQALTVSPAAERVLGYPVAAFAQAGFWEGIVHPDDLQAGRRHLSGAAGRAVTFRVRHADGRWRWMESRATTIWDRRGREAFIAGVLVDRTPEVEADLAAADLADRLAHQARHDELTGLPNRRFLLETLEANLSMPSARACALFLFDLDDFKDINDSLGHHTGDQVLLGVGRRIGAVTTQAVVARLGGDEFAVLACDLSADEALAWGERFTEVVQQPIEVEGLLLRVRASVGIALFPDDALDPQELMRRADVAMYRAKGQAESPQRYDAASDLFGRERVQLSAGLYHAVPNGELVLHYQPLIAVRNGAVCSLEALSRWQHPELGLLPPARFIEMAEVSGEIRRLTRWAVRSALEKLAGLGDEWADVDMSVNLSVRNVYEPDFVDWLTTTLADTGIAGERLVLEITEGAVMVDYPAAVGFVERLRALGVRTWIDDFGTGHSSLARLRHLPVDGVKIDRSFVTGAATSDADRKLLAGLLSMVHSLGLTTIAEGVEDPACLDLLTELGCDIAQGYLFGRPSPVVTRRAGPIARPTPPPPRAAAEPTPLTIATA
jgi:diguanylate cyclase (GGDEF)-like protein/PAS domain S-box-containing protein